MLTAENALQQQPKVETTAHCRGVIIDGVASLEYFGQHLETP
jgi:hypothetical protein